MISLNTLLVELQGQPHRQQEIRETIRLFFYQMWEEAGRKITPEILKYADLAYDAPVTDILAEALGINVYDLRDQLGRNIVIECKNCGNQILVRELRVKNGYKASGQSSDLCDKCKQEKRKENTLKWKEHSEKTLSEHQQQLAIDKLILQSPRDPRILEFIKPHLLKHLTYWMNSYTNIFGYKPSCSCMLCNRQPVGIFLITDEEIYSGENITTIVTRLADSWHRYSDRYSQYDFEEKYPWPPLRNPLQLIWRLDPQQLFGQITLMPVNELPLLFLCDKCMDFFQSTHYEPYQGERWSIKR